MRSLAIVMTLAIAFAAVPSSAWARPGGGGGGGARGGGGMRGGGGGGARPAPASRPQSNQGRGFNLGNDVPSTRPAPNGNRQANNYGNHQGNNNGNRQGNNNGNRQGNNTGNGNKNGNGNNNGNKNNGNKNNGNTVNGGHNTNVSGNTVNVNKNYNGYNGYGYHGAVVVNPVYGGPAWGWNRGVVWAPNYGYWGGGFWGPFAAGAATAAVMGAIVSSNQTYTSYQVNTGSPGATLLSNYGLQQVPCGPPGLVVVYGPNNGVICANPNDRVAAGNYAVNENNLTLQSQ